MSAVPPNRPNADHQGDICVEGSKFAHQNEADTAVQKVPTLSPEPAMIADPSAGTGGTCDCSEAYISPGLPHTDWNSAFHGDGTGEKWQGAAQDLLTVQTFDASGTYDARVCHKQGFKAVLNKRFWHGSWPFDASERCSSVDTTVSATQFKYTSATVSYTRSFNLSGPTVPTIVVELTVTYESVVDPLTGLRSLIGFSRTETSTINGAPYSGSSTVRYDGWLTGFTMCGEYITLPTLNVPAVPPTYDPMNATELAAFLIDSVDGIGGIPDVDDAAYHNDYSNTSEVRLSSDEIYIKKDAAGTDDDGNRAVFAFEMQINLSGENSAADIESDLVTLADEWQLNDDVQYPWRTDVWFGIMPLVCRREVQNNVEPILTLDNYTDPNASAGYDGAIIGSPAPSGTFGWFDFYGTYWRTCDTGGSPPCSTPYITYSYAYGGTLADHYVSVANAEWLEGPAYSTFLPRCTTHWTNNQDAHAIPPCAFIDSGIWLKDGALYLCKTAMPRPDTYASINFARPCGADAYQVDEPTATAITLNAAPLLTLETPFATVTGKTLLVAFTGDSATDGIYTGCTQAGSILTLGTRTGPLPAGYSHPCEETFADEDTTFGLVGILRWPAAAACAGQWNDVSTKGDLRYGGWFNDGRDATNDTFACNPDRLPFSQCYPSVICFSPNGEAWPTVQTPDGERPVGKTYWFGDDGLPEFVADGYFGASVQAAVEWYVADLFYQTPQCGTETPPRVEARCDSVLATGYGGGAASNDQPPAFGPDSLGQTPAWPAMSQPVAPGVLGYSYTIPNFPWT